MSSKSGQTNRTTVEGSIYSASNKSGIKTTSSNWSANARGTARFLENPQNKFMYSNPGHGYNGTSVTEWEERMRQLLPHVDENRKKAIQSLKDYRQRYHANQRRNTRKNRKNRRTTLKRRN
jgi:hypothetical protein